MQSRHYYFFRIRFEKIGLWTYIFTRGNVQGVALVVHLGLRAGARRSHVRSRHNSSFSIILKMIDIRTLIKLAAVVQLGHRAPCMKILSAVLAVLIL